MSRSIIDTTAEAVERIAWTHHLPVEADATHEYVTYVGVTYRAPIGGAA